MEGSKEPNAKGFLQLLGWGPSMASSRSGVPSPLTLTSASMARSRQRGSQTDLVTLPGFSESEFAPLLKKRDGTDLRVWSLVIIIVITILPATIRLSSS